MKKKECDSGRRYAMDRTMFHTVLAPNIKCVARWHWFINDENSFKPQNSFHNISKYTTRSKKNAKKKTEPTWM